MNGRSLLETVHGLLARTYRIPDVLGDVGRFVIGDEGLRSLYAPGRPVTRAGDARGTGARTLVRESGEGVRVCVYYPDAMIRRLEENPPQRGLGEANVDAFATLVEELDHLLCIADRAREGRPLTLFELELHANVSKHLVLTRFLAGSRRQLPPGGRNWLRYHLFGKGEFEEEDPATRGRYRDAARWGVRFLDALERLRPTGRIETLRRFHRASASDKVALIGRFAA